MIKLISNEWIIAFLINFILILLAQNRLRILTSKGWINAGVLGTLLWGCLGWQGWTSVVGYLFLGSVVTKIGFKSKAIVGLAESRGGQRSAENVWGSAAVGSILAILYKMGLGNVEILLVGFAASFSAKLADTFGSEIGKLYGKRAFLITNFTSVKPGVDGAISLPGTFASLIGAILMTSIFLILGIISNSRVFIIVVFSGFIATLFESIIGATFQKRFTLLTNEMVNAIQTGISAFIAMIIFICINMS